MAQPSGVVLRGHRSASRLSKRRRDPRSREPMTGWTTQRRPKIRTPTPRVMTGFGPRSARATGSPANTWAPPRSRPSWVWAGRPSTTKSNQIAFPSRIGWSAASRSFRWTTWSPGCWGANGRENRSKSHPPPPRVESTAPAPRLNTRTPATPFYECASDGACRFPRVSERPFSGPLDQLEPTDTRRGPRRRDSHLYEPEAPRRPGDPTPRVQVAARTRPRVSKSRQARI